MFQIKRVSLISFFFFVIRGVLELETSESLEERWRHSIVALQPELYSFYQQRSVAGKAADGHLIRG